MFNPYIDVIGHFYPLIQCHASEDTYESITNDGTEPIPPKETLEPLILEFKRLRKWEEIKSYRDIRLDVGGYPTSVGWFHSDALSRDNYEDCDKAPNRAALQYLQDTNQTKQWKTMSGTWVGLTVSVLNQLLTNKVNQKNTMFYSAEVLKVALWMSNDPDNFDYKQNPEKSKWPVIYGE